MDKNLPECETMSLREWVEVIVKILSVLAGLFLALFLFINGLRFIVSFGNIYIGIIAAVTAGILFIIGFIHVIPLCFLYWSFSSIFAGISFKSIQNYRDGIHTSAEYIKKIHQQKTIRYLKCSTWEKVLTYALFLCILLLIIQMGRILSHMLAAYAFLLTAIITTFVYFADSSIVTVLACVAAVLGTFYLESILHSRRSIAFNKNVHVLTLLSVPLLPFYYINGHYLRTKKYSSVDWLSLSVDEKKKRVRQEISTFADTLLPGKYFIETHDTMFHLIKENLSPDVKLVREKKLMRIFSWKAYSDFRLLYGKDWKKVFGKRNIYVWYFELGKRDVN